MIIILYQGILSVEVETTRINGILYQAENSYIPKPTPTNPSILFAQILWM
jgi:hypothetical protein